MIQRPPRPEVIEQLSKVALSSMDGCGIEDITTAEVLSAIYTMAVNATKVVVEASMNDEVNINKDQILNVVAQLYELVAPSPSEIH